MSIMDLEKRDLGSKIEYAKAGGMDVDRLGIY